MTPFANYYCTLKLVEMLTSRSHCQHCIHSAISRSAEKLLVMKSKLTVRLVKKPACVLKKPQLALPLHLKEIYQSS